MLVIEMSTVQNSKDWICSSATVGDGCLLRPQTYRADFYSGLCGPRKQMDGT